MEQKRTTTTVKKTTVAPKSTIPPTSLFDKENFKWMLGGAVVMIIGFLLMAGGRSDDPNVFNNSEVYSTTRITIAPIVILAGLIIEIVALFRTPKSE